MAVLLLTNLVSSRSRCEVVTLFTWPPSKRRIVYVQPTMYRPEVSRSAQSRSHTTAYTYRTRAQIPQLRARQSTNSALTWYLIDRLMFFIWKPNRLGVPSFRESHVFAPYHLVIEEVGRHISILWKLGKQIRRKSLSNVPPKLLAFFMTEIWSIW